MTQLFSFVNASTDNEFNYLRDNPHLDRERSFVESLLEWYEQSVERNRSIRGNLPNQFHDYFWQMYLARALVEQGYEPILQSNSAGPDICLRCNETRVWVEATVAHPGTGSNAVSLPERGPDLTFFNAEDQSVLLRYTNAITAKHSRYLEYIQSNLVSSSDPYVIAVNGRNVQLAGDFDDEVPYFFYAVLGVGPLNVSMVDGTASYSFRPELRTAKGSPVPTTAFLNEDYAGISGLLFSRVDVLNVPEKWGRDFIFLHNPRATTNRLPLGWLKLGREYWVEGGQLINQGWS